MTMAIKNEIKEIAVRQHLSDWSSTTNPVALYDAINETPDEGLDALFEAHGVITWAPFETFPLDELVDQIINLATRTQALLDGAKKTTLSKKPSGPTAARIFFKELSDSVETLSGIGTQYGVQVLADLMWLHHVIMTDGFVQVFEDENSSKIAEVVKSLPSAAHWMQFVRFN